MIRSRFGLVVLAAIVLVLAAFVAIDVLRAPAPPDRRLVTIDIDKIREVRIADITVRRADKGWELDDGPANAQTIDALLTALRGGRWHRSAPREAAGPVRASVTLDGTVTLGIGAPLPGAGQTWIARHDDAVLVDDWIAHALSPDPIDWVDRHPLAGVMHRKQVAFGDVVLAGAHRVQPPLWIAPDVLAAIAEACDRVEIATLGKPRSHSGEDLVTGFAKIEGPCLGELLYLSTRAGSGCVPPEQLAAVKRAIGKLRAPAEQIVDRRPLPIDAPKLELPDHAVIDSHSAEPDRALELYAALRTPAEIAPLPAGKPTGTITAGDLAIDLYDHVLVRRGEPLALRPTAEAWKIMTRPSTIYRDPTRWLEEPTTISALTIDGTTYRRGAVLGEWTGARDPAVIDALAGALATLRAPAAETPPTTIEHHIELAITPPAGPPTKHTLDVGRATPTGCPARADGTAVTLPLATCAAIAAAK